MTSGEDPNIFSSALRKNSSRPSLDINVRQFEKLWEKNSWYFWSTLLHNLSYEIIWIFPEYFYIMRECYYSNEEEVRGRIRIRSENYRIRQVKNQRNQILATDIDITNFIPITYLHCISQCKSYIEHGMNYEYWVMI